MLVDIQKMPPVFGIPLNRRLTIYSGHHLESNVNIPYVYWPTIPLYHHKLHVGSLINTVPQNLYKAIYISLDNQYVFETVFSMIPDIGNKNLCLCLYTNIIHATGFHTGISLKTIEFYQDEKTGIFPVSNLIAPLQRDPTQQYRTALAFSSTASDLIVPPIFKEKSLWEYIDHITDISSRGMSPDQIGWAYKPLYDHEPQVFEAMMQGHFNKSPFHELSGYHPALLLTTDKWFLHQEVSYSSNARGFNIEINHPGFDLLALEVMSLFPGKISLQCLISHAVDGLKDIWLTKNYHNPYHHFFNQSPSQEFFVQKLESIFYVCVMTYCQIYEIDSNIFLEKYNYRLVEESSITITKNLCDEIVFSFHDLKSDRYVSFYSSFPALALSTMAVGWY